MKKQLLALTLIISTNLTAENFTEISSENNDYMRFNTGLESGLVDRSTFFVLNSFRSKSKEFQNEVKSEIIELEFLLLATIGKYFDKVDPKEKFNPKNPEHKSIKHIIDYLNNYQPVWMETDGFTYQLSGFKGKAKEVFIRKEKKRWETISKKIKNWNK